MKKIALCFLTYDNLTQPELWYNILNDKKFNVYIHNKNEFECHLNTDKFCLDKRIETAWGHKSLVEATLLLFKKALKNNDNAYFVLLSDKCIPLYTCNDLYKKIISLKSNNINVVANKSIYRFNVLKEFFIDKEHYTKHHQWIILNRDTANIMVKNDIVTLFNNFECLDEHYFGTLCNFLDIEYESLPLTFVDWNNSDAKHPKTFYYLDDDILEKVMDTGALFMRKISTDCALPDYFNSFGEHAVNKINQIDCERSKKLDNAINVIERFKDIVKKNKRYHFVF